MSVPHGLNTISAMIASAPATGSFEGDADNRYPAEEQKGAQ